MLRGEGHIVVWWTKEGLPGSRFKHLPPSDQLEDGIGHIVNFLAGSARIPRNYHGSSDFNVQPQVPEHASFVRWMFGSTGWGEASEHHFG